MSYILVRNLLRNPLRSLLTVLSIAVTFLLFGLLGALENAYDAGVEHSGSDRLMTMNSVSVVNPIPLKYARQVQQLQGVAAVLPCVFFGAYYQTPKQEFFAVATEGQHLFTVYPQWRIPQDRLRAWLANRSGAVIGRGLADQFGFKIGDRVAVGSLIFPQKNGSRTWELTIEGIFDPAGDPNQSMAMYFHYEYFDSLRRFGQGTIAWFVTKLAASSDGEAIARQIDAQFAAMEARTKTSSEKTFAEGFARQFGNISLMVTSVLVVVLTIIGLIAATTMAQTVQERRREYAIMRAIGFGKTRLLQLVLAESCFLALLGGAIGLVAASIVAGGAQPYVASFVPGFMIDAATLLKGGALSLLLGAGAGLLPGMWASRVAVAQAMAERS